MEQYSHKYLKIGKLLSVFVFFSLCFSFTYAQKEVNPKVVELCKKAKHELNANNFEKEPSYLRNAKKFDLDASEEQKAKQFKKAADYLKKAKKIDSTFADIYVIEGDMYNFSLESEKAVQSYNKAIQLAVNPKPLLYFITASEEMKVGMYAEALTHYNIYLDKTLPDCPLIKETMKGIQNCEFSIEGMKHPVKYNPVNMGANINSEYDEYLPAVIADETEIIYTVMRPRDKNTQCAFCLMEEDFYTSKKENGEWQPRTTLGYPVNTGYNEGAQCISPDGKYLFYTMCNTDAGVGSCDLFWSKRIGSRWSRPHNFGAPVNTKSWESQPSIGPDGKTIYFISNRSGGEGGMDIWKTEMMEEGVFTVPVNIGKVINTEYDEAAAFIHADGKTLYFASNGHPGFGGMDIYYSTLSNEGWSKPTNLGYPINSPADEINLLINAAGTTAYYSSDKDGGFGGQDLYTFELDESLRPTPVTYIKGTVYDEKTHEPLKATIELIDLNTNEVITSTSSDPQTGTFLACILTGSNILMNVSNPYYPFYSENFQIEKNYTALEPYEKNIALRRPDIGETFVLRNVFFDFDKSILKNESNVELDKLAAYLKENQKIRIELGGHTDNHGSDTYNKKLSLERAKAVYDYLISKGIAANRMSYEGYGATKPIATNETDEGRALNRRTEFKIVGY